ncbi:TPA: hypothetical protein ACX6RJ_001603, partial [Photobacterium damselae]
KPVKESKPATKQNATSKAQNINALFKGRGSRSGQNKTISAKLNKAKYSGNGKLKGLSAKSSVNTSLKYRKNANNIINNGLNGIAKASKNKSIDKLVNSRNSTKKVKTGSSRVSAKNALSKLFFRNRVNIKNILLSNGISHARIRVTVTIKNSKITGISVPAKFQKLSFKLRSILIGKKVGNGNFNGKLFHTIMASN